MVFEEPKFVGGQTRPRPKPINYRLDPLLKFVLVVSLIMNLGLLYQSGKAFDRYNEGCDTCKMLDAPQFGIEGYYMPGEYICYMTKDRNSTQINDTIMHEECHNFVYEDYDHFCLGYPQ